VASEARASSACAWHKADVVFRLAFPARDERARSRTFFALPDNLGCRLIGEDA